MVTVSEELVATDKSMNAIIASVKQLPLSARFAIRRIDALPDAVQEVMISGLNQANYFSQAIDESTDNTDVAQMCVYVRYFDGKVCPSNLIPLEGHTTGDIIFMKLEELFRLHSLSFEKVNLIVTDGAPAMEIAPQIHGLHCLIHQSVLCARLSGELKEVMDKVMRVINFVRGTSNTQHRLFRQLVVESEEATYDDLLLHNDVCWLTNFTSMFEDYSIPKDIIAFVHDPLTVRPGDFSSLVKKMIPLLDGAAFQMELIDFQTTSLVIDALRNAESVSAFWVACLKEYSTIKTLAFYVLTMFPSTYTCESTFSSMNAIKTHERNRLTLKNLGPHLSTVRRKGSIFCPKNEI
uniref:HAT C-terminal dimerisation domain-containing protein n=1 Tax=Sinocyclocheilus rhinocerous TaxID=307959 RepID=A0A673J126_9TELE